MGCHGSHMGRPRKQSWLANSQHRGRRCACKAGTGALSHPFPTLSCSADANCLRCEGSPQNCTECKSTGARGFYIDAKKQSCTPCTDPACAWCTSTSCESCLQVRQGVFAVLQSGCSQEALLAVLDTLRLYRLTSLPAQQGFLLKGGSCTPCTKPHCADCHDGPDTCSSCQPSADWVLDPSSRGCVPVSWTASNTRPCSMGSTKRVMHPASPPTSNCS